MFNGERLYIVAVLLLFICSKHICRKVPLNKEQMRKYVIDYMRQNVTCFPYHSVVIGKEEGICSEYLQYKSVAGNIQMLRYNERVYAFVAIWIKILNDENNVQLFQEKLKFLSANIRKDDDCANFMKIARLMVSSRNLKWTSRDLYECERNIRWMICRLMFPICGYDNITKHYYRSPPCQEACNHFLNLPSCKKILNDFLAVSRNFNEGERTSNASLCFSNDWFGHLILNCSIYPKGSEGKCQSVEESKAKLSKPSKETSKTSFVKTIVVVLICVVVIGAALILVSYKRYQMYQKKETIEAYRTVKLDEEILSRVKSDN